MNEFGLIKLDLKTGFSWWTGETKLEKGSLPHEKLYSLLNSFHMGRYDLDGWAWN